VVERAAILSSDVLTVADLPEDPHLSPFDDDVEPDVEESAATTPLPVPGPRQPGAQLTLREFREGAEKTYILDTLKALDWNISKAAVVLGVERTNLHKKIRAYGIKRGDA
jgi:two-component system, NtrC family, nitrogen regulation response regulator NtrX